MEWFDWPDWSDTATLKLYREIAQHLVVAMVAGGLIGLERSFHGRPAGLRTHTLVCLSSSLLMMVTLYQGYWFEPHSSTGTVTRASAASLSVRVYGCSPTTALIRSSIGTPRRPATAASPV